MSQRATGRRGGDIDVATGVPHTAADLGCAVLVGSPAEFGKLIAHETEKWAKVIKFAVIRPD